MFNIKEKGERLISGITGGYEMVEEGVVTGYKQIEAGVVSGFNCLTDKFVGKFLTREGESVEEARARLTEEQKAREVKMRTEADRREADRKARIEASLEASRNAGKRN